MIMDREERRAAAREGILAAAHRQVAEGGCASASVVAVAARAGVAAGSLYRHFDSRAELLAVVLGDALRAEHALLAREAARDALTPPERLEAWVRTAVARRLAAPTLAHALLAEPVDEEVERARRREVLAATTALAELLAAGAASGAWPAADHLLQAVAISGAVQAATVGPLAGVGGVPDPEAVAAKLVAVAAGAVGVARRP